MKNVYYIGLVALLCFGCAGLSPSSTYEELRKQELHRFYEGRSGYELIDTLTDKQVSDIRYCSEVPDEECLGNGREVIQYTGEK